MSKWFIVTYQVLGKRISGIFPEGGVTKKSNQANLRTKGLQNSGSHQKNRKGGERVLLILAYSEECFRTKAVTLMLRGDLSHSITELF